MARVIAMLQQARSAGFDVHRDGPTLVVRGAAGQGHVARELLDHKALVLAALEHEEECREHERSEHFGQPADWRLEADGRLVCGACHPAAGQEDVAAAPAGQASDLPACSMCGSTGRREGRLATPDGGWVCLAAVADGVVRVGGRRPVPGRPPMPEAGR